MTLQTSGSVSLEEDREEMPVPGPWRARTWGGGGPITTEVWDLAGCSLSPSF